MLRDRAITRCNKKGGPQVAPGRGILELSERLDSWQSSRRQNLLGRFCTARRGFMTATDIKDATEKRDPPTEASLLCRIDPKQFARSKSVYLSFMKISDFTCPSCASVYEVAESLSAGGSPGRAECTVCGKLLESWQAPKLRAYRLVMSLEHKYRHCPAPPSPTP